MECFTPPPLHALSDMKKHFFDTLVTRVKNEQKQQGTALPPCLHQTAKVWLLHFSQPAAGNK